MIENVYHFSLNRKLTTLMQFWMEEVSCHLEAKRLLVRVYILEWIIIAVTISAVEFLVVMVLQY